MKSLIKLVGQSHVSFFRSGRGPLQDDRPLRLPDVYRGGYGRRQVVGVFVRVSGNEWRIGSIEIWPVLTLAVVGANRSLRCSRATKAFGKLLASVYLCARKLNSAGFDLAWIWYWHDEEQHYAYRAQTKYYFEVEA